MGYTSTAVKAKYNKKTYKPYSCQLRNEVFDEIETLRKETGLSRAEFLKLLVCEKYDVKM